MDPSSSMISKSMGKTNNNDKNNNNNNNIPVAAADPGAVFKCPRCESTNTKFCYYNNYSLSQPRHFCKACKRYWTRGGTLRNVPVGGGCRKHKKRPPPYNHGISTTTTDPIQKQKQKERERDLASPTNNIIINNIPNPPAFLFTNNTNNSMGLHFPFSTSGFGFGFSSSSLGLMDNNFSTAIQLQGHNKYYSSTTTTTTGGLMKEFIDDEGAAAAAEAVNHTFPGSLLYHDHKNSNMQINYEGTAKDDGVLTKILMDDDQEKYNINNHMVNHDHHHVHLLHTDTSPSSSHLWNTTWYDPSSSSSSNYMGSSVPSLI